jgi:hypothetical protein
VGTRLTPPGVVGISPNNGIDCKVPQLPYQDLLLRTERILSEQESEDLSVPNANAVTFDWLLGCVDNIASSA